MDQGEAGRLLGELCRVRLAADLGGAEGAAAGGDEGAGHHLVARALDDRVGLAGEQGLVDLQAVRLADLAVDDDLVARADLDEVAEDDLGGGDLARSAVPAHGRLGLADHREAVQGPLGAPLLEDADAGVGDDDEAEEAVLDRRDEEHDHPEDADDGVEPGEDVGAGDLGQRAGAADGDVVDLAACDRLGDLGRGQSGLGRHGGRGGVRLRPRVDPAVPGVRTPGVHLSPLRHDTDVKARARTSPPEGPKIRPGYETGMAPP